MASRAALAVPLLLQTPPGQLPNVYEDLSGLVGSEGDAAQADEDEFKKLSSRVREEHNLEQYIVVDLPNGKGKSILCPSAAHAGQSNRFLAPRDQVSFVVDHETLVSRFWFM
jgi:capping protein alpha